MVMNRWRRRGIIVIAGVMLVAACTSSGDGGFPDRFGGAREPGPDAVQDDADDVEDVVLVMSDIEADTDEAGLVLRWEPVDSAAGYRVAVGEAEGSDVPAGICSGEVCEVTLTSLPQPADGDSAGEVSVAAVTARGTPSVPSVAAFEMPEPEPAPEAEPGVVVVRAGGGERAPEVELVPVSSEAEAQALIEAAGQDSTIVAAALNAPVVPTAPVISVPAHTPGQAEGERERDDPWMLEGLFATWQVQAMAYDLLPGDPPGAGVRVALIELGGVDAARTGPPANTSH